MNVYNVHSITNAKCEAVDSKTTLSCRFVNTIGYEVTMSTPKFSQMEMSLESQSYPSEKRRVNVPEAAESCP